jgi:hypothetical protein
MTVTRVGGEVLVNTATADPQITAPSNGGCVVTWTDASQGASAGDSFSFIGFGTAAGEATFTQIGATNQWQIHSALDAHNETINLSNNAAVNASDFLFS